MSLCTGCGKCCASILPISKKEIENIQKYIDKNGIKGYNYNEEQNIFNPEYVNVCPFLDPVTRNCKVYEVRPQICRDFECKTQGATYEHKGRRIRNFYEIFCPEMNIPFRPNTVELDKYYQAKKKLANIR